jgi:hypothetical protein
MVCVEKDGLAQKNGPVAYIKTMEMKIVIMGHKEKPYPTEANPVSRHKGYEKIPSAHCHDPQKNNEIL